MFSGFIPTSVVRKSKTISASSSIPFDVVVPSYAPYPGYSIEMTLVYWVI
jgi:hypothetical protein